MTKWELWGTSDDMDERGHYYIRRDGRSVDLGDVVGELVEMEEEIVRLRADLEREQTLRAAYKQLPEQYHRGMLTLLVQAAFESAAISHGRAAELLECSVQDIRERGWVQGRKDEEIERLRAALAADEPQPDYCDCDGVHDGSCREREIKRLRGVINLLADKLADYTGTTIPTELREVEEAVANGADQWDGNSYR